jgi:hypothetical protein
MITFYILNGFGIDIDLRGVASSVVLSGEEGGVDCGVVVCIKRRENGGQRIVRSYVNQT